MQRSLVLSKAPTYLCLLPLGTSRPTCTAPRPSKATGIARVRRSARLICKTLHFFLVSRAACRVFSLASSSPLIRPHLIVVPQPSPSLFRWRPSVAYSLHTSSSHPRHPSSRRRSAHVGQTQTISVDHRSWNTHPYLLARQLQYTSHHRNSYAATTRPPFTRLERTCLLPFVLSVIVLTCVS